MKKVGDLHITGPEWRIEHLQTPQDCDYAIAALIDAIAKIDYDLASDRATTDPQWARIAHKVRSLKVAAKNEVEKLKASFATDWNQLFVNVAREVDPTAYNIFAETVDELLRAAA